MLRKVHCSHPPAPCPFVWTDTRTHARTQGLGAAGEMPQQRAGRARSVPAPSCAMAVARRIVRLLALALGLPADHFDPLFKPPIVSLRPLHYSATPSQPDTGVLGAGTSAEWLGVQLVLSL